jgi:hypothetical protein
VLIELSNGQLLHCGCRARIPREVLFTISEVLLDALGIDLDHSSWSYDTEVLVWPAMKFTVRKLRANLYGVGRLTKDGSWSLIQTKVHGLSMQLVYRSKTKASTVAQWLNANPNGIQSAELMPVLTDTQQRVVAWFKARPSQRWFLPEEMAYVSLAQHTCTLLEGKGILESDYRNGKRYYRLLCPESQNPGSTASTEPLSSATASSSPSSLPTEATA